MLLWTKRIFIRALYLCFCTEIHASIYLPLVCEGMSHLYRQTTDNKVHNKYLRNNHVRS